jgi:hypothetical protein
MTKGEKYTYVRLHAINSITYIPKNRHQGSPKVADPSGSGTLEIKQDTYGIKLATIKYRCTI